MNENKLLKSEIAKKNTEIENLRIELQQCQAEKETLAKRATSGFSDLTSAMMKNMGQQNSQLQARIDELEKEIAALKGQ